MKAVGVAQKYAACSRIFIIVGVGRYGGDEFMAVIYHTGKTETEELLQSLCREKDRLNSNEAQILINYARNVI